MRVIVVFEFPDIKDPNSRQADDVVDTLTQLTAEWSADIENCQVYVDDVEGDAE